MRPLKPIMAALVIASVGAMPLRTLAESGTRKRTTAPPAPAAKVVLTEDRNPLNALARALADGSAITSATSRLSDFLLMADANKSFVAADVDRVALRKLVGAWVEAEVKVNPSRIATLYFVAGPGGDAPTWAKKDPILAKTFIPKQQWEGRLRAALSAFTVGAQIKKAEEKTATTAFLNTAAEKAASVFAETRTIAEINASIDRNDTTAVVVPSPITGPRSPLDTAQAPRYNLDQFYRDGAVVMTVSGTNDKFSRLISMKIYSTIQPDGTTVEEIGVFDITTSPKNIFGQRFPLNGDKLGFVLDNRSPGREEYDLKFVDGKITFARTGGGPASLETSLQDLFLKRADQAAALGNITKVGDQEFYVVPQGGQWPGLALFPKAMIDDRGTGDARKLKPKLYAEVGQRASDGSTENVPDRGKGGPHLGKVGDKEYHLEFNERIGAWEVKDGAGDLPPARVAKPAPGDPATPPGSGTGPGGGPVADRPDTLPGGRPVADLERLLFESGQCKKNPDDVEHLRGDLKTQFSVIYCEDKIEGRFPIVLVPKTTQHPTQQWKPKFENQKVQRVRFFGHYMAIQFEKPATQYYDLLKMEKNGFALAGLVGDKTLSGFHDVSLFVDGLKHYMGIKPGSKDAGAFTAVPERVKKHVTGSAYALEGAYAKDELVVRVTSAGKTLTIWPEVKDPGAVPDTKPYASLTGPANAFDPEISSTDAPFLAEMTIPNSHQVKIVKSQPDIALYKSVDLLNQGKPAQHYAMFKYVALDPESDKPDSKKVKKVFRQKLFEVFNSTNPYPGDDKLQMQGLTQDPQVLVRGKLAFRFIADSTTARGVLAVFQEAALTGDNQKDKKHNCVGPIMWWGVSSRDAALKICQNDKF